MPQTVVAVPEIAKRGYAHPEVLVSTQWVEEHRTDPKVRIVESNEDILLYETGHIPGAVKVDWVTDLNDPLVRDYLGRERFERLLRAKGINNDTTIVFYGDKNNWWATYAFWVFTLFGVEQLKVMDGGMLGLRGFGETPGHLLAYIGVSAAVVFGLPEEWRWPVERWNAAWVAAAA